MHIALAYLKPKPTASSVYVINDWPQGPWEVHSKIGFTDTPPLNQLSSGYEPTCETFEWAPVFWKIRHRCWKSLFFFFSRHSFFSSPELCSGWAIVITFRPSSVHPSVRPSVRASVNIFKRLLLWNRWANFAQISYGASLGWGNEKLLKWSRSVDQDGRHAHIW